MLQSALVVLMFSVLLSARAVTWRRLQTWCAFSPTALVVGLAALLIEFGLISCLALVVLEQAWPAGDSPDLHTVLVSVGLAHASARRAQHKERAGTLLFGLAARTVAEVDRYVVVAIERRLRPLPDPMLLALRDRLDAYLLSQAATQQQIVDLADLRRERAAALASADPHVSAVTRTHLVSAVSRGWMEYTMGDPS